MNLLPIRKDTQIAVKFEDVGRHAALEVLNFPSKTEAKRYVRVKRLTVRRGSFAVAPKCQFIPTRCHREEFA